MTHQTKAMWWGGPTLPTLIYHPQHICCTTQKYCCCYWEIWQDEAIFNPSCMSWTLWRIFWYCTSGIFNDILSAEENEIWMIEIPCREARVEIPACKYKSSLSLSQMVPGMIPGGLHSAAPRWDQTHNAPGTAEDCTKPGSTNQLPASLTTSETIRRPPLSSPDLVFSGWSFLFHTRSLVPFPLALAILVLSPEHLQSLW